MHVWKRPNKILGGLYIFAGLLIRAICLLCMAQGLEASLECNSSTALLLATRFRSLGKKGRDSSSCPDEAWLPLMADADHKERYIMVNVGYNKGYNFANWMQLFAPATHMTPSEWFRQIDEAKTSLPWEKACGECIDCRVAFARTSRQTSANLALFGVDLNEQNTHLLQSIMKNLNIKRVGSSRNISSTAAADIGDQPNFDGVSMELHHAAVSDHDGHLAIKKCAPGEEKCAITPPEMWNISVDVLRSQSDQYYQVRLMSVDSFAKEIFGKLREKYAVHPQQPMDVDILMVDTEGNDPLVLKGSAHMLSHRLVRCVIFEYHFFGQWEFHKLEKVVQQFDKDGYDCFFQGQKRLWAISNSCWHPLFEFHGWSNVMCLRRGDVWLTAVERLVVTS